MNDRLYRWLLGPTRFLSAWPPSAACLGLLTRVFGRQIGLLAHLRRLQFDSVVDGGANAGEFAALVRTALPGASLLCVEPHAGCAARLRAAGYRVEEAALWREAGTAKLFQPTDATTSGTICEVHSGSVRTADVKTVRLDQLALPGQRILLKLDLQGAELAALEGVGTLWPRIAAIHLEMRVQGGDRAEVEALLRAQGFFDYATTNEIIENGWVTECDKLWLRPSEAGKGEIPGGRQGEGSPAARPER